MKLPFLLSALLLTATIVVQAQETYGTIRATTKLRPDGTKVTTILDPEKHTAEETLMNSDGKVLRKTTHILGEGDKPVGAIFADATGKVIYKASYQRDAAGRVTQSSFNGPDDRYLGKRIFYYGSGENATRAEDYDANNQLIARPEAAKPGGSKKRR